jgi:hypothetical protein
MARLSGFSAVLFSIVIASTCTAEEPHATALIPVLHQPVGVIARMFGKGAKPVEGIQSTEPVGVAPGDLALIRADVMQRCVDEVTQAAARQRTGAGPRWAVSAASCVLPPREAPAGNIELPDGVAADIVYYTAQNAMLVRGTQEGIAELREILSLVDVPSRMVRLRCQLLDAGPAATGTWGAVQWDTANGSVFPSERFPAGRLMRFARLRSGSPVPTALERTTPADTVLIASHTEVTSDGHELALEIGQASTIAGAGGAPQVAYVGTEWCMVTRTNADDSVTVDVEIRSGVHLNAGVSGAAEPLFAQTEVTIHNGGTIAIAIGESSAQQSTPGVAKWLEQRANPVFLITPTVLKEATVSEKP